MQPVVNPSKGFTFVPSVVNTDGTAIATGEIVQYNLLWGQAQGGPYPNKYVDKDFTPDANGKLSIPIGVVGKLAPGDWFAVVQAQTSQGVTSDNSAEVGFTIAPTPTPPTNFSVA